MSSLLVKEMSELPIISSSQTASESMLRSASLSLRLLAIDKFSSSVDERDFNHSSRF